MLVDFVGTPTSTSAYSEVWVVGPDDERTLFIDHPEAVADVRGYHVVDVVVPATMEWTWDDDGVLSVTARGEGRSVDLTLTVTSTLRTRLLTLANRLTPDRLARSRVGTAVATWSLRTLVDVNGLKVGGRTDTGARYWTDAERITHVSAATAHLDGVDLGPLVEPRPPTAFGDIVAPDDPIVVHGALWMPVE
ncbi:hypothetical protein [Halomarina oriensis]|uniref:Uncharacterized protein n=1 Tax=Halomarina oriensis TaxID=671145 RepID=A0A6B0GFB3_9EURY|nr:hypothetical protein [Halomarina oriensis]MWG33646.1 hypothetical protein [Halomarina oriensis]